MDHDHDHEQEGLSAARWRTAISLTLVMLAVYVGFILLVAFNKPLLGRVIVPGLSVGILLGVLVIGVAWLLTWWYIRWANAHDAEIRRITQAGATGTGRR